MKQQVNLYQPMFRRQRRVFSAVAMLQVLAVVLGALFAIYGFGQWQLAGLREDLQRLEARRAEAEQRNAALEQRYPAPVKDPKLEAEVRRLGREVARKERLLAALSEGAFGNSTGFSTHLRSLARSHVQGLWLNGFVLASGGTEVALRGYALQPELVPVYLQRLAEQSPFKGRAFSALDIRRVAGAPPRVAFDVRTAGVPPAQDEAGP